MVSLILTRRHEVHLNQFQNYCFSQSKRVSLPPKSIRTSMLWRLLPYMIPRRNQRRVVERSYLLKPSVCIGRGRYIQIKTMTDTKIDWHDIDLNRFTFLMWEPTRISSPLLLRLLEIMGERDCTVSLFMEGIRTHTRLTMSCLQY